ncbi:MAG TPA: ABC transporter permease [Verrucomicrobiae bacterium]|nr:ABC transporter permease [Verrucomicrobiae bacterium]
MQKILAIAWLTWKAAFRFRLFLVIAVLLLAAVVGLPLLLKDDGTARGFTQILITYTLSVITALLGLSTLWLACGTLARDIEECQIQVVASKPVARWQIWLGKWLGIVSLNAALLALSGASVYGLLQWRATRLPAAEQEVLRTQVLVARGVAQPADHNADIDAQTEQLLQQRLKQTQISGADLALARQQLREQVKAAYQLVPSGYTREWQIDLGFAKNFLHGRPLQLRVKFNTAQNNPSGTFIGLWQVGEPGTANVWRSEPMSLSPDTYHEFEIPADLFNNQGVLTIAFLNPNNTTMLFPIEDGMEVLYPQSSFTLNFARGLGILFCWMALLAAIGLTSASFLSFPVATFFSLAVLVVVFSGGTLANAVASGTTGIVGQSTGPSLADMVLLPLYRVILPLINLVQDFSPIDSLSTGRAIPWSELGAAFGQIVLLLGGVISAMGIGLFARRELATAQGNQ